MHHRKVPGVENPVSELLRCRSRVLQVALHHNVAPHHHLANRLAISRYRLPRLGVDDIDELEGDSANALPGFDDGLLLDGQRVPLLVLPLAQQGRSIDLRQPIDVDNVDSEFGHAREDRRRRGRSGSHQLHLVCVVLRACVLQHRAHQNRGAAHVIDLVLFNHGEDVVRHDLPKAHMQPGQQSDCVVEVPTVAMKHWQRPQVDGMLRHIPLHDVVHCNQVRAPVVQQHTFGVRSGAAGVAQRYGVPLLLGGLPSEVGIALRQEILVCHDADEGPRLCTHGVVDIDDQRPSLRRQLFDRSHHARAVLPVDEDHLGLGMPQHEGDVSHIQAVVQWVEHSARHGHAEVRLYVLGRVAEHPGDDITPANTTANQGRSETTRALVELTVGPLHVAMHNGCTVGIERRRAFQEQERG
mmetsp:Transcript_50845/g.146739  ORF Transcript_50845/g.146739 Transcript_50845/m.146739 type:complete len:411 (+) Transcript_50845:639-1871(+)